LKTNDMKGYKKIHPAAIWLQLVEENVFKN